MLRLIVYGGITIVGVAAALANPLAGAIACIEAYLLNPVVLTGPEIRYQLITNVAFLIGFVARMPKGVERVGREGSLLVALWAFVAIGALSATWAVVSAQAAMDTIYEVAKTVLFTSLLVRVVRTERQMSYVIAACILGVWHAAVLHTFGVRLGFVPRSFGRETGVLPDAQSAVMVMFVPMMALLAVRSNGIERVLSICALPFVLNSVVSSYQRTYFSALIVELVVILLFLPRRITLRLLPVLALATGLFVFVLTPPDYWSWIQTIAEPTKEASANSRLVVNEASWRIFQDYPILGVGYRNYPDVSPRYLPVTFLTGGRRSAHNSYLTVACETGIVGFVPWIWAFAGSLWALRRIRKTTDPQRVTRVELYAMGVEVGYFGWLMGGMTMAEHEVDTAYWFVGFTVLLTRLHHQQRASREAIPGPEVVA